MSEFKADIEELYKSYRLQHFSLKLMAQTYYDYKENNPQISNFKILDKDLEEMISFTHDDLKEITEHGKYQEILAATTIILFYQLWEDNYRVILGKKTNQRKDDVNSDFFAELNKIRRAIVHNQFNPKECIGKLKILDFIVSEKKKFLLSSIEISQVYFLINQEIDRLTLELMLL